jgi:predicted SpoU family rRNA methylase
LLALVEEVQRISGGSVALHARAVVGAGLLSIAAEDTGVEHAVALLRSRFGTASNVVVLQQSSSLKTRLDAWGPAGSTAAVLKSLKQTFDPAGILNAGRGPL